MKKEIIQRIVLAGILIYENKALILQRNKNEKVFPNMWELPSGKKEPLEKSEDALAREFLEETGVEIKPICPVSVFDYKVEKEDGIRDSTQINYLVYLKSSTFTVKISNEHQNYKWISKEDIAKNELSNATKNAIDCAFLVHHNLGDK